MSSDTRARVEHELFLRSMSVVQPTAQVTSQLSSLMQDEYYERGATILTRGEPATRIYFVVAGRVEMLRDGAPPWVLEDESMVGILDASRGRPYSRTAIAGRPTHALSLPFADYLEVMEDNFDFSLRMMKAATIRNNEIAVGLGNSAFEHLSQDTDAHHEDHEELDMTSRLLALHHTTMFARAPVQALVTIAQRAEQQKYSRGSQICRIGKPSDKLLLLVRGRARMQRADMQIDVHVAPTRALGGGAAFGHDEWYFDISAETDVTTLALDKEDLLDTMEDHFGLLRSFFGLVASERERLMQLSHGAASIPPGAESLRS